MNAADPASGAPDGEILLHSLALLAPCIVPALELAGVRSVVEVGVEGASMTAVLRDYLDRVDGCATGIDPHPSPAARAAYAGDRRLELIEAHSPGALAVVGRADAYLLDGDHNHWTVLGELRAIATAAPDGHPLVFVHDAGWPAGRRDQYYDPAALPAEAVHPHTYAQGVRPGTTASGDGGFRGEGAFAWAIDEGGPANGVRTAVEDFVAEAPRFRWAFVPSLFGLAVVWAGDAPYAAALEQHLAVWADSPLLAALEANRIDLYLRVLDLQDALAAAGVGAGARLRDENARLRSRVADLEARLDAVRTEADAMGYLKALRAVDAAERVARRRRPGATLRQRIGALADVAAVPDRLDPGAAG